MNLLGGDWNEWKLALLAPRSLSGRVVALAIVVVVLGLAFRALRGEQPRRRLLLLSLRAMGILATLFLFFQPTIRLRNVSRMPNHIAVIVDASESMRLAEEGGGETRAGRAAAHLRAEATTIHKWRTDHKVEFFTFGDRLQSSTWDSVTHPDVNSLRADSTRIREALSAVRQRFEGRDLAGVILFSDGLDNGRLSAGQSEPKPGQLRLDADTQEFLRALDVPVHTVAVGKPGLRDIALTRVLADQFAFARTSVEVEARLQVFGAKAAGWGGRHLPVTLRRDGVPILTVDIEVQPEQREYRVIFPFTPDRVGKFLYDISVPVQPGEAISENNRRAFVLKVVREKIRVVHVAGRPSWDARFLRAALKSDPNIDLVAFFILRSPSDIEFAPSEETSLIPFPCQELFQEQLRSFDLLILQNFNYSAYCSQFLQPAIVPFVEGGGSVAMIGGDLSFSSGGYYGSELSQILPVVLSPDELSGGSASRLIDTDSFVPKAHARGTQSCGDGAAPRCARKCPALGRGATARWTQPGAEGAAAGDGAAQPSQAQGPGRQSDAGAQRCRAWQRTDAGATGRFDLEVGVYPGSGAKSDCQSWRGRRAKHHLSAIFRSGDSLADSRSIAAPAPRRSGRK